MTYAGELVRAAVQGEYVACLVAAVPSAGEDARALIPFQLVRYTMIPPGSTTLTLSYGKNYVLEVDQNARVFSSTSDKFERNGALLVGTELDSAMIRIFPREAGAATVYYEVATGVATTSGEKPVAQLALLDWRIRLTSARPDDPPFFAYTG